MHSLGVLGLLLVLFLPLSALASQLRTYESLFTPEGRKAAGRTGTYAKDSHVWVYTSAFAKRFGMPKEWIDDSLQGAQALAYRVDYGMRLPSCGYFGELENCRPTVACVLDMYIADEAELPWNTESGFDSYYGYRSNAFLNFQEYEEPSEAMKARRTKRGNRYHLGLDRVYVQDSGGSLGNYNLAEYDRDIYAGLDYLSGTMNCGFGGGKRRVRVKVAKPAFRANGDVDYNRSLKDGSPHIAHQVDIPDSFMTRVDAYAKAVYEPNSLWAELKQRLSVSRSKAAEPKEAR